MRNRFGELCEWCSSGKVSVVVRGSPEEVSTSSLERVLLGEATVCCLLLVEKENYYDGKAHNLKAKHLLCMLKVLLFGTSC